MGILRPVLFDKRLSSPAPRKKVVLFGNIQYNGTNLRSVAAPASGWTGGRKAAAFRLEGLQNKALHPAGGQGPGKDMVDNEYAEPAPEAGRSLRRSGRIRGARASDRLFDEGTFVELDRLARDGDKPAEAAAGYGMVEGSPVYAFAQDHAICSGAIGRAQAAKIAHIYALAAPERRADRRYF